MNGDTLVIVNNAAARARRTWPEIARTLQSERIRFEVHKTTRAGDATIAARSAIRQGFNVIAVVGGDGTISETAQGFFDLETCSDRLPSLISEQARLAILPAGTGDDFARGLINERASTDRWTRRLINYVRNPESARTKQVDAVYGTTEQNRGGFVFVNAATLGIGPEVAAGVAAQNRIMRSFSGDARFFASAFRALAGWRERRLLITVDEDRPVECSSNLVAVANSVYAGGGMMLAPEARADDGLLDLLITRNIKRRVILRELTRIRTGGHLANPNINVVRCTRARIQHLTNDDPLLIEADGNLRGQTPVEFRVIPGVLTVVV